MTIRAIFSIYLDGDSCLNYACRVLCADIPAAVRWIAANPCEVTPPVGSLLSAVAKPAHPLMSQANGWAFYGSRADIELLDQQSKAGDFGYVVEEMEVVK